LDLDPAAQSTLIADQMRACIFCDGRAITREHAWPEWLLELLSQGRQSTMTASFGPNGAEKTWRGANLSIKVKYLCGACNNGWMSDLENRAKRWLGPMLQDLSIPLDQTAQALVARWSVKTAIVFECTNPTKQWFYSVGERRGVMAQRAPEDTLVWIGRCARTDSSYAEGKKLLDVIPGDKSPLSDGYATTFGLGRLVVQVVTLHRKPGREGVKATVHTRRGTWKESLVQVWPPSSGVRWPPRVSFSESGPTLDDLSGRFRASSPSSG
jgi:hypothetical protein